jgi:ADP-heptose:LPS heptosyltransferase
MTAGGARTRSPLSGRYLVHNRGWNAALRLADAVLSRVAQARPPASPAAPSKILIAVGGHLGDAVIATSVLPVLARAYPNAQVGMLLPSWSRVVVEGHPALRWIHHADHWKMSRAGGGSAAKWRQYRASAAKAVQEIRAVGYDVAIDLYAYYPNSARLLWQAGIPTRVGYTSGGCGPLYTSAVDWTTDLGHTATQHAALVAELTAAGRGIEPAYDLPPITDHNRENAKQATGPDAYIVVHPGTGDKRKAWPIEQWRELVKRLTAAGERVVITGAGAGEGALAESIESATNLVDRIDWPTFRGVLAGAKVAIGADSVAMHVAAAEHTPSIAIMAAMSDPEQWRPLGAEVSVLTRSVPCAPCFQKAGCEAMTCVRDVTVDDVLRAVEASVG